mgnify:CR=1 FL=1
MPEIIIIAAVATESRIIGSSGELPWDIPEDLGRFQRLTTGGTVLMGRRTFESILREVGGPLPDRETVVLTTTQKHEEYPEVQACPGVEAAMNLVSGKEKLFICGGESVYQDFLSRADRLELTLVEGSYEGDTYFPPFRHLVGSRFQETARESYDGFSFVTLDACH